MLRKVRRLSEMESGDRIALVELLVLSFAIRTGLIFVPLPKLAAFLSVRPGSFLAHILVGFRQVSCTRLAELAELAARLSGKRARCLIRSLALFSTMKARGESAKLLIGVNKTNLSLEAHAWVETNKTVVGDSIETTERFATLVRL